MSKQDNTNYKINCSDLKEFTLPYYKDVYFRCQKTKKLTDYDICKDCKFRR